MTDIEFSQAISSLAAGNKDALRQIYIDYNRLVYTVVLDVVKRREDAEDVTSDFFIKLIRVAPSFKTGSPHKAWLITIARNLALDHLRKSGREIIGLGDESDNEDEKSISVVDKEQANINPNPVEVRATLSEDMRKAMETLKPEEREVVDMKLVGDMKFKEIAETLGKPMGTVTWTYNEAVKKLRRCLSNYG